MIKKFSSDIIFFCIAMLFVFTIVILTSGQSQTPPATIVLPPTPIDTTGDTSSYTLQEVATHKDASSCWTIVRDFVYDVTSWATIHPGGKAQILGMCGIDASSAFVDQHGGKARPEEELASFKIGILKK
jgi:cytochrome b involved in lipid metabolism